MTERRFILVVDRNGVSLISFRIIQKVSVSRMIMNFSNKLSTSIIGLEERILGGKSVHNI